MVAVATAFAVIFAKEVFGGTGMNIFNVALVTRAFLFFAYPSHMSGDKAFVKTDTAFGLGDGTVSDAFTGATPLGQIATHVGDTLQLNNVVGEPISTCDAFMGLIAGSTTDPPALAYATSQSSANDRAAVAYSTVYPLTMFLRVLTGQLMILLFI